jgi:GAF domain-containing protein
MPLLHGDEMAGVIELFSFRPNSFNERDERTLQGLAEKTVRNLERATAQIQQLKKQQLQNKQTENKLLESKEPAGPREIAADSETAGSSSRPEISSRRRFDLVT